VRTDEAGQLFEDGTRAGTALQELIVKGASLSGHERNRVYVQTRQGGTLRYVDASLLSGLDAIADGRSFAWFDFDRDGRRDVVLTNANEPRVQLFRNQLDARRSVLAIRLQGANHGALRSPGTASNRDAIGARIDVLACGRTHTAELRAGEGLAAQNSGELLIGLGECSSVDWIRVGWPSGQESTLHKPPIRALERSEIRIIEP